MRDVESAHFDDVSPSLRNREKLSTLLALFLVSGRRIPGLPVHSVLLDVSAGVFRVRNGGYVTRLFPPSFVRRFFFFLSRFALVIRPFGVVGSPSASFPCSRFGPKTRIFFPLEMTFPGPRDVFLPLLGPFSYRFAHRPGRPIFAGALWTVERF